MSSGSHAAHAAAADHDHAFDGEPTDELPADEPRTPGWIPVLGIVLFVTAAVGFLATRDTTPPADAPAPEHAAAEAPAAPPPVQPQQRVAPTMGAAPSPAAASADAALRRLSPDQLRALQKQIDVMKAKQGGAPPPAPQPGR
jgi:hypothetical protein